ncbi:YxlC family protein [Symbiobacterium thermophilum]|uniref:YxlC family protein n=1 Tax=Symbiobacterium thermophilum TaxID=2734 RepID=UPI0035C77376
MKREPEPWERSLRDGLDAVAGAVDGEQPPDLGALIMLVDDVQRAQRLELRRDLRRFVAVAALILFGWLWAWLQFPAYFLVAQGLLAAALAAGAALAQAAGRRVSHE